ncbi:MAG: membrane protein required for colicin V production [Candidatus Latescibacterota bacterium]|jgi:membrane protein required for colicin V production
MTPKPFLLSLRKQAFMNSVDLILGIILLIAFYTGYKKGLFVALASLVGLVLGAIGAIYFSGYAGMYLAQWFDWSNQTTKLASFAVTFLVIIFIVSMLGKALTKIADFAMLGLFNKLLGSVFTMLQFAFIVSVVLMFLNAYSSIGGYVISEEKRENSKLYYPVAALAPLLVPHILNEVDVLTHNAEGEIEETPPSEEK